jgi:hypothetical protein
LTSAPIIQLRQMAALNVHLVRPRPGRFEPRACPAPVRPRPRAPARPRHCRARVALSRVRARPRSGRAPALPPAPGTAAPRRFQPRACPDTCLGDLVMTLNRGGRVKASLIREISRPLPPAGAPHRVGPVTHHPPRRRRAPQAGPAASRRPRRPPGCGHRALVITGSPGRVTDRRNRFRRLSFFRDRAHFTSSPVPNRANQDSY